MPNITIDISQEKIEAIKFAFQKESDFSDIDLASVITLGIEQWLNTLLGITRFRSMTELYINWFHRIFAFILPKLDPDEKNLVSRFNIPYGQASYIARVLREEGVPASRLKWLTDLETRLAARLDEARTWKEDDRGEEMMEFRIHKNARRELALIMSSLMQSEVPVYKINNTSTFGDVVYLQIRCSDLEILVDQIRSEKERLGKVLV